MFKKQLRNLIISPGEAALQSSGLSPHITWAHGTAASLHIDGLSTREGRAANGGAEGLTLQAVAVCAAINIPAFLICVCFSTEVANHFLWNCIFC